MEQSTLPGIETGEVESESTHAFVVTQWTHLVGGSWRRFQHPAWDAIRLR
jgi:hypothetical protein